MISLVPELKLVDIDGALIVPLAYVKHDVNDVEDFGPRQRELLLVHKDVNELILVHCAVELTNISFEELLAVQLIQSLSSSHLFEQFAKRVEVTIRADVVVFLGRG